MWLVFRTRKGTDCRGLVFGLKAHFVDGPQVWGPYGRGGLVLSPSPPNKKKDSRIVGRRSCTTRTESSRRLSRASTAESAAAMDDLSIEELASNLSTYKEQLSEVPLSLSLAPLSFLFCLPVPFPYFRDSSRLVRYRECSAAVGDPDAVACAVSWFWMLFYRLLGFGVAWCLLLGFSSFINLLREELSRPRCCKFK
jgi:hypothetical protein